MAWVSNAIEFVNPSEDQKLFEGDITLTKVNALVLQGVVMENEGKQPVPGALVMVYARLKDGKEEPLCQTFSSKDGHYLLHVDKKKIPGDSTAIIVRANAGELSS
jgi:hypothetical protein